MLLSVIIPAYNAEQTITSCIDSVLSQSLKDLEIIIINDGSTDATGEICDCYFKKDNRIKVINQSNSGQAVARNVGLNVAEGKYIAFLDSDDKLEISDLYETYINFLENNKDVEVIQFPTKWISESKSSTLGQLDQRLDDNNKIIQSFLKGDLTSTVWDKIYKKDLFKNIRFTPNRYFEDAWFVMDLIRILNHVKLSSYGFYSYETRMGSEMNSKFSLRKCQQEIDTYIKKLNLYDERDYKSKSYAQRFIKTTNSLIKRINEFDSNNFDSQIKNLEGKCPPLAISLINFNSISSYKLLIIKLFGVRTLIRITNFINK